MGMFKIAITPETPGNLRKEAMQISTILDGGWDRVHLRHPGATLREMQAIIEALPQEMHSRLVIHGHFELVNHFKLGGLHLNRRCPIPPANYHGPLSRSCHSIEEIKSCSGMDYVTLSPIFNSISKTGYLSAFTPDELAELDCIPQKVIALGGVTPERIDRLKRYNFSGFAMLGALPWKADSREMADFIKLTTKF